MAPVCSNCGGTEFVWANELKTGSLGGGSLSLRSRGELSLGTRICRACGHADLFLKDPSILRMPHTWRPGEFTPIVPRAPAPPAHHPAPAAPTPTAPPVVVPAPTPMPTAPPPAPTPSPSAPTEAPPASEVPAVTPPPAEPEVAPATPEPAKKPTRRRSPKAKSGGDSSS